MKLIHDDVCNSDIRLAFYRADQKRGYARAGRVVAGLLKSWANSGRISRSSTSGRVSGETVWYEMTADQLSEIRSEAKSRI